jgi:hypothetical protein
VTAIVNLFVLGQVRDPLPTPPFFFDLIVIALFGFGGWRVWKLGREFRWLAVVLWLVGLGGVYSFVFTILAGAS